MILVERKADAVGKRPILTLKTSEFEVVTEEKNVDLCLTVAWPQTGGQSEVRVKRYGHFTISAQSCKAQPIALHKRDRSRYAEP